MYTGLRSETRLPIDHLVVEVSGGVVLLVPENVPSHRIHQPHRGEVPGLVHGDPRHQLAAWHIPEKSIPHKIRNHAEREVVAKV